MYPKTKFDNLRASALNMLKAGSMGQLGDIKSSNGHVKMVAN